MTQDNKQTIEEEIQALKPEDIFRTLAQIRKTAKPLEPLWGFFLFKKAITSIIGDPGVCKTSMGYGLTAALCEGKPFLDIPPDEPVKALYMDFESSDSLVVSRANLILSESPDVPNLWIYNIVDYYLNHIANATVQFCNNKGINLLVVDNQSVAFNTRDENDNAEAIRQMKALRRLTNAINAAMIVYHHPSKGNLPGTRKGSGAFARARLADICVNLELPDEENHPEIVRLQVVKNRMVDEKVLWYIKKEEGRFVLTEPTLGMSGQPTNTLLYKAQEALLKVMTDSREYKHSELIELAKKQGIDDINANNALWRLTQQGILGKPRYGYYVNKKLLSL